MEDEVSSEEDEILSEEFDVKSEITHESVNIDNVMSKEPTRSLPPEELGKRTVQKESGYKIEMRPK